MSFSSLNPPFLFAPFLKTNGPTRLFLVPCRRRTRVNRGQRTHLVLTAGGVGIRHPPPPSERDLSQGLSSFSPLFFLFIYLYICFKQSHVIIINRFLKRIADKNQKHLYRSHIFHLHFFIIVGLREIKDY